ncbi:hypothetical protein D9619_003608 [Psilocybe cf. subviscida]|uniref:CBM1 domain-containing protein n=1 Tax=Psilocybe cf. subviscida TaxID=2480587 RepID=A0A8H5ETP1_9AGAR|nr:hypothetical protein D9619_003608 [Psilocybe cf. subviscida]
MAGPPASRQRPSEDGMSVSYIDNGDYIKVRGVAFGSAGAKSFSARVSSATSGGKINLHSGSATGTLVDMFTVSGTSSWTTWTTVSCPVSGATGTQDLYLVITGGSGSLFNFNWWQFSSSGSVASSNTTPPASSSSTPKTTTSPASTTTLSGSCTTLYGQCGGQGWAGPTCCSSGTCKYSNDYYSQCL